MAFKTLTVSFVFALAVLSTFPGQAAYLKPQDFGIQLSERGVPVGELLPNVALGDFDHDGYQDITIISGDTIKVYRCVNGRFRAQPYWTKVVDKPVKSIKWRTQRNRSYPELQVEYKNGHNERYDVREVRIKQNDYDNRNGFFNVSWGDPVRFGEVWRSENYSYGTEYSVAGDLDDDGFKEFVTYSWSDWLDTLTILHVFKNVGDDTYQEVWDTTIVHGKLLPLIGDIDGNGKKEFYTTSGPGVTIRIFESVGVNKFHCYNTNVYSHYSYENGYCVDYSLEEMDITDIDNDGVKEITILFSDHFRPHGVDDTKITIDELSHKSSDFYTFTRTHTLYDFVPDCDFAVGDIDNDGSNEMVIGSTGFYTGDPIVLLYFDYDPLNDSFTKWYIYTGLTAFGVHPRITDIDQDGQNELIEGGANGHSGSIFVLKSRGTNQFYVDWYDSSTMKGSPLSMEISEIGGYPSIVAGNSFFPGSGLPQFSQIVIFQANRGAYAKIWQGPLLCGLYIRSINCCDMDSDGRENLVFSCSGPGIHQLYDYELNPDVPYQIVDFGAEVVDSLVEVFWKVAPGGQYAGFNLYRAYTIHYTPPWAYSEFRKLNKSLLVGDSIFFVDSSAGVGVTNYYWLEVIDLDSLCSFYGPVMAYIEPPPVPPPVVDVYAFKATGYEGYVRVRWQTDATKTQFDLYRSTTANGEYVRINLVSFMGNVQYTHYDSTVNGGTTYYYKLLVTEPEVESPWFGPVLAKTLKILPKLCKLYQGFPNPFNQRTVIRYQFLAMRGQRSAISLRIYNILGQIVRTLVDEEQGPDFYEVVWDGKNDSSQKVGSGVYLCRLKAGNYSEAKKLIVLR